MTDLVARMVARSSATPRRCASTRSTKTWGGKENQANLLWRAFGATGWAQLDSPQG